VIPWFCYLWIQSLVFDPAFGHCRLDLRFPLALQAIFISAGAFVLMSSAETGIDISPPPAKPTSNIGLQFRRSFDPSLTCLVRHRSTQDSQILSYTTEEQKEPTTKPTQRNYSSRLQYLIDITNLVDVPFWSVWPRSMCHSHIDAIVGVRCFRANSLDCKMN
jgi:hypothetical protein